MKKLLLFTLFIPGVAMAQQPKQDSTYRLSEKQIIQISQLLDYGLKAAGNSDRISTKDYNEFARQVAHIDSLFRSRYQQLHSQPKQEGKKP